MDRARYEGRDARADDASALCYRKGVPAVGPTIEAAPRAADSAASRQAKEVTISGVSHAPEFDDHEQVVFCRDRDAGLRAIIAIHDTTLGPALGGCRMWPYPSEDEALADALRLSQAMTYKHALAGTGQGGGKAVIIGDSKTDKTAALLRALGRHVDALGGRYIVAEDIGTSVEDMGQVRRTTRHVAGDAEDPSPVTAYGVFHGIKAAVHEKLGRGDLDGLSVAVQGLGHVGYPLCGHLHEAGARLFVADTDGAAVARAVNEFSAVEAATEEIYGLDVDVFAPCALGGVINDATIPGLKSRVVAGAANNQLARAGHGWELAKRGILYAPDYVINAGGIISISLEGEGYDRNQAMKRAEGIFHTVTEIFRRAAAERLSTNVVADRLALERLGEARRTVTRA